MQFLPLFVGYFELVIQEFKHHSLQSARCLADGLFDRLEWLMVCMHRNVLLPVQILVPFVHACNDCEALLFDLRVLFFSVAQGVRGKAYRLILL